MIRKPSDHDFREGTAVTVLRETKRTAVESGHGVSRGMLGIARFWLYGIFWIGILTTAAGAVADGKIWQAGLFLGVCYGVQQMIRAGIKMSLPYVVPEQAGQPRPIDPHGLYSTARNRERSLTTSCTDVRRFRLSIPVAMRQSLSLLVPGLVLLFLGPLMLAGFVFVITALLIVFKAVADNDLLQFDDHSVTVNGLLSKRAVAWADVVDISATKQSWYNAKALMKAGCRRTIVLTARRPEGGLEELLIPMDLLDLGEEALIDLVADMIACRTADTAPATIRQPEPRATNPTPASDPRESFDPDAIMTRYLTERAHTITAMRADTASEQTPGLRTFGRKAA